MARNRALASAQKAYQKGRKARQTQEKMQKPKKKKIQREETPKVEKPKVSTTKPKTPKVPSTNVSSQYNSYKKSSFAPKVTKAKPKVSNTSKGTQNAVKPSNSRVAVGKSVVNRSPEKKKYDYKKDLQKAYKKGSQTTYLGTKQTETTTKLKSKKQQKQEYKQTKKSYYKSQDWKNTKNELKTKNREGWRSALSDQGWSRAEIDAWMNSDEGKKYRKETYMEAKDATKKSINKSIANGIKDTSKLKSVNALTRGEFDTMVTANAMGKKRGNKYLETSTKRFGTKDIREKIGSKTAESAYKGKLATGIMQGMSKGDVFSGSVGKYNKGAKEAIKQTKESGAYGVGYGVGMALDMGMGSVATRGASLAELAGKGASKLIGKGVAKEVPKKALKEATEELAKVSAKDGAKRFAKNRVGELVAESPANVMDAVKMSLDENGNLDKGEFKKWLVVNNALTLGMGGAMEGIGAGATKKLASKTEKLIAKREAGTITADELTQLNKNIKKLTQKAKGDIQSMSSDIADARMKGFNAKDAQRKAEKYGELVKDSANKGRKQGVKKGKFTYEASQSRYNYAKKLNENEQRLLNRRIAREQHKLNEKGVAMRRAENFATAQKQAKALANEAKKYPDRATIRKQIDEATELLNNLKSKAENPNVPKKDRMEQIKKLEDRVAELRRQEGVVWRAEKAVEKAKVSAPKASVAKAQKAVKTAKEAFEKNPTPENRARMELAEEAQTNPRLALNDRLKEAGLPDHVTNKSPDEIKQRIADGEEAIRQMEKEMQEAQRNQKKAFASGKTDAGRHYAKVYNELKGGLDEARNSLEDFRKADEIASQYGETEQKGFATFGKEESAEELENVGLAEAKDKPIEPKIELKPKEGESTYQAHRGHVSSEKQKAQHRKDLANNEKAVKETKGLKSAWKKFYSMFVSDLEPFERMAMSAATKEERKRGRVTINGLLTARSKAMTKVRNEGMAIFEKRGLHKDAEKAKAYDDFALFAHELDRLKQKDINVYKDGVKYNYDFGEGVIQKLDKDGNWKKYRDLPDGKWKNYRNMSDEDIRKDIEKLVKDNDLEWDQVLHDKGFTGYSEKTLNDMMGELRKQYGKDIDAYQKEISNYHKDLLKEDMEGGIISKERYEKLLEKYPNYVPTFREYDDISARSFNEDLRAFNLYNAKGADDMVDIIPQYTQMIAKTNAVMKRTAENEMLNTIAKINNIPVEQLPHGHTPDELIEVSSGVYKVQKSGEHRIYFRRNGEGISMPISEEAYHAIRQWSGAERAAIMEFKLTNNKVARAGAKALNEGSRAFKALITDYSIIFGCRNFVRDTATALVYSEHPAQWLASFPKAVMAMKKGTKYHAALEQYIKDGGRYNALVTSTDLGKMPKLGKKEGIPGLRVIKDFNTTMETLPRMSEYISTIERLAKKNDMSFEQALKNREITQEAMYNAKEVTLNFDRGGQYGRMLNRGFVPFFNPSVQGADKLVRFLAKDNRSLSEFMAMGAKMAGMVVAPTIAWEYFVNQEVHPGTGDEGMGEAYRKLSAYNKYAYFCVPMGKDENGDWEFLKIPRAREMAAMQMPIDWFIQNVKWQNRDGTANLFESAKQAGRLTIEQIGPVNPLTDNYFSPIWNLAHNKNWMGGSIEGYEDEEKRKKGYASDIYDTDTSSAAVTISTLVNTKQNALLKKLGINQDAVMWLKKHQASPKQIDNLFDSYLGVIYDMGIRPFSQEGASLKSVKDNPGEESKRWLDTTFGTAFVVNGTLSSQRKTGMYSKLYDMKDKLEEYDKGSKEYAKLNKQISEYNNRVVYDVQGLDTAIDAINKSKKYTGREKAELVKALKREQNSIIDDYNNGKSTIHDPLKTLINMKDKNGKRVFSDDEVFSKLTYTNSKSGTNSIASGWEKLKTSDYYKQNPKKAVRDFKEVTFATREAAGKMNDSKSFMDWQTMAIVCTDKTKSNGKDYSEVLSAYGASDAKKKIADVYINQMGGSTKTYIASHKRIVAGAAELGKYPGELEDHDYAMILANARTKSGNKLKDRAYWVEDNKYGSSSWAYERMNYARCLSDEKYADSKWTYKKVHKFAEKYNLNYSSADETIVNAINARYPNKTQEEKAALFGVIKPTDENPFGEIGDYSVDGDTGYEKGGKGHGRRGRRHGRRGGGGGGGGKGATFKPEINTAGSKSKVTNTSKSNTSKKSNLNDAYRKQLKKLREETRQLK